MLKVTASNGQTVAHIIKQNPHTVNFNAEFPWILRATNGDVSRFRTSRAASASARLRWLSPITFSAV